MIKSVIAFKKAVAEVGFKKAIAAIDFKKAVTEVSFKKAIAAIDFKKAIAEIKFGFFLIFRFFFESLGVSDTQSKSVGKSLTEGSLTIDEAFTEVGKSLSDSLVFIDSTALGFGTAQNDSGATSDQINTFAIGKLIQDAPSVGESIFIETAFNRAYADVFYAAESISVGTNKPFADSFGATDEESLQFSKALADAYGATDATLLSPNKFAFDSSGATDNQNMDFHKFINEITGVTDDLDGEATAEDDQEMTFVKVRSDLAVIVDAITIVSGQGIDDTIGASDSGSLLSQSYVEFGYFLEDYVGVSRNF